jgi:hypothetical protein
MKDIRFIKVLALGLILLMAGCTGDFEWRNTNADNATEEMMTYDDLNAGSAFKQMTRNLIPSYQLTGDEEYGSGSYQVIQDLAGNIFAGYTGVINTSFNGNNKYNVTNNKWYEAMFNDAYTRAINPWNTLDGFREQFPEKIAMADIVKVGLMHRVTDTYGPIPYSNVGKASIKAEYDSQQKVYLAFFEELGDAIDVLTDFYLAQPNVKLMASDDDVFYGDIGKWIKYANTLRLRLALRVVYADAALSEAQAKAAYENPVGLMTSASDIAQLNKAKAGPWENPLYIIQNSFDDSRIGATIEAYMNGYEDNRRSAYFMANSIGEYRGVRNGINVSTAYASSSLLSRINYSNDDALLWMAPSEAFFLLAECKIRGWNWVNQSEQELYEQGIRVSFMNSGVSGADDYIKSNKKPAAYTDVVIPGYSNEAPSDITVAWDDADGFEIKLEKIITQKYIAIFPDGQEAWSEFRRTGYPKIFSVSVNNSSGAISTDKQIRRLNYPSTEYNSLNAAAVQAAVSILASESSSGTQDNGGTHVWWDKK